MIYVFGDSAKTRSLQKKLLGQKYRLGVDSYYLAMLLARSLVLPISALTRSTTPSYVMVGVVN